MHGYEEWGSRLWERLRGMFAVAVWDARARRLVLARDRFGIKPLYYRAAGRRARVRVRARRASARRRRPRRARSVPRVQLRAVAALDLRRHPQAAPGSHAHLVGRHGRARAVRTHGAAACTPRRGRGRARRGVPRSLARLRSRPPRVRRAGRCAALRRRRLGPSRRTGSRGVAGAGAHVLDRFRGGVVRRARRRPRSRAALRHDPPRADARARCRAAAAGARGGVRRAVRRLVGTADVPRLEAGGGGREGRALRRRERRALRRLLHVRRRSAGEPVRRRRRSSEAARRAAPVVDPEGELRLQGEAIHPCGRASSARAPPRLEGDLLGGCAGGAHGPPEHRRSADGAPRTVRREQRGTSS